MRTKKIARALFLADEFSTRMDNAVKAFKRLMKEKGDHKKRRLVIEQVSKDFQMSPDVLSKELSKRAQAARERKKDTPGSVNWKKPKKLSFDFGVDAKEELIDSKFNSGVLLDVEFKDLFSKVKNVRLSPVSFLSWMNKNSYVIELEKLEKEYFSKKSVDVESPVVVDLGDRWQLVSGEMKIHFAHKNNIPLKVYYIDLRDSFEEQKKLF